MKITEEIIRLQQRFADVSGLSFHEKRPGFIFLNINNRHATASISLYGAQVIDFAPHGERPVLWESACSFYAVGKPLRGGIPLCWPWFGAHPENPDLPAHGLARLQYWEVAAVRNTADGVTEVELTLTDSDATREVWPYKFKLTLKVTVAETLTVELITRNTGTKSFRISEAMHTYFTVSDIHSLAVKGFDGCEYLDTLDQQRKQQKGDIRFTAETDCIYQHADAESYLVDPAWRRIIANRRSNSGSAVVWNPWIAKSIRMPDFGDTEYPFMVCVETANVGECAVTVEPETEHQLAMTVRVMPLL